MSAALRRNMRHIAQCLASVNLFCYSGHVGNKVVQHLALPSCQVVACRLFGQPCVQTHPHLLQEGEVTPGITKAEYRYRRTCVMEAVQNNFIPHRHRTSGKQNHVILIPSASKTYMTNNIPYPFRQNTEFLYFSGFQEPDSALLIENKPGTFSSEMRSVLFVPRNDPSLELWEGPRSGLHGTLELTGVDETVDINDIHIYLQSYRKQNPGTFVWYDYTSPAQADFQGNILKHFAKHFQGLHIQNPRRIFHQQRLVKSESEIELMKQTCAIASEAFVEVMDYSHPGVNESHLYAKMDFECRVHGANYLAYPPVVAGGNRANTIHYIRNDQIIEAGDMVLMDAGCELHGYTSDITRTWPVSGHFNPAQRELYEALLEVQQLCIGKCTGEYTLDEVFHDMLKLLGKQLGRLHMIPQDSSQQDALTAAHKFCPHHVSHYLGMDVHDTGDIPRCVHLEPNMIITIEPGIYIPQNNQDVPKEFRGIGIRIEDDVLVTETDPIVLTAKCPKIPSDIEIVMQRTEIR